MAKRKVTDMLQHKNPYPELSGFVHLRRIVCFYDAALDMLKAESQYPRDRVHWSKLEAEEVKREGEF
jgi:hypothetical protein